MTCSNLKANCTQGMQQLHNSFCELFYFISLELSKFYFVLFLQKKKRSYIFNRSNYTVKSRFYEPPRETKSGLKDRVVGENGGKISVRLRRGNVKRFQK